MFLGSVGAFFWFVPLLSVATIVLIMLGLVLMFGLGVQVGTPGMSPFASIEKQAEYSPSRLRSLIRLCKRKARDAALNF